MVLKLFFILVACLGCFEDLTSASFPSSLECKSFTGNGISIRSEEKREPKEMKYLFEMIHGDGEFGSSEELSSEEQKAKPSQPTPMPKSITNRDRTGKHLKRKSRKLVNLQSLSNNYEASITRKKSYLRDDSYSRHVPSPEQVDSSFQELTSQNADGKINGDHEMHFPSPKPPKLGENQPLGQSENSDGSESSGKEAMIEGQDQQQEKLLLYKLMEGYERDVRPVKNSSHAVVVRVGITLTQIFDMDEKAQIITSGAWMDTEWNDEMLRWNPSDFGGLEMIRLPSHRIWLPDIVLYNNADDYTRGYMPSRAMVSYDGNVFWPPPTKFRSTCSVDVTYFPFDDQVCSLKLGSWTYNGFQVDVTNRTSKVDLSNYVSNGEWELIKAVQQRNVVYYSCCIEPFPDVTITLVIRRKTLYYIYNIVLPCIMLSSLTLLVFCLPPDSGEKIALGITVLLAFSVFMLAINESLPETSESIPLIGVYITIVMAITSVSVIMTVVVLNLHYLGPQVRPVPSWLRCFIPKGQGNKVTRQKSLLIPVGHREPKSGSLKRSHIFITQLPQSQGGESYSIEVPSSDKLEDTVKEPSEVSVEESVPNENNTRRRLHTNSESSGVGATYFTGKPHHLPRQSNQKSSKENGDYVEDSGTWNVFEELLISIRQLINKQEEVEAQNNLVAEWRLLAQVADRVLFWLFFAFTTCSSAIILLVIPIYKRSWYGSPLMVINDTDIIDT